jgi:hypothetical protein
MASVYKINKGINRPIEFKGLKAQYIMYLAAGLVLLLLLFAILYLIGVSTVICLGLVALLGTLLFTNVYRLSKKFGQHGMLKRIARQGIPEMLRANSRRSFASLRSGKND